MHWKPDREDSQVKQHRSLWDRQAFLLQNVFQKRQWYLPVSGRFRLSPNIENSPERRAKHSELPSGKITMAATNEPQWQYLGLWHLPGASHFAVGLETFSAYNKYAARGTPQITVFLAHTRQWYFSRALLKWHNKHTIHDKMVWVSMTLYLIL